MERQNELCSKGFHFNVLSVSDAVEILRCAQDDSARELRLKGRGGSEKSTLFVFSEGAVGGDRFSFGYRYGLAGGPVRMAIALTTGPANLDGVGFLVVRDPESQNEFAGGEIAGAAAKHLRLRFAASAQFDGRADAVAIGFRPD